jgi:hypothetical protein
MFKKAALALFGLIFSIALITPQKADAQVVVRVAPRPYVYVAPPVVYRPYYTPYAPVRVWIGGRWVYRPYGYRYHYAPRYWRR